MARCYITNMVCKIFTAKTQFNWCVPFTQKIQTASHDELEVMLHEVDAELYRINELQLIKATISSKKVEVKKMDIN